MVFPGMKNLILPLIGISWLINVYITRDWLALSSSFIYKRKPHTIIYWKVTSNNRLKNVYEKRNETNQRNGIWFKQFFLRVQINANQYLHLRHRLSRRYSSQRYAIRLSITRQLWSSTVECLIMAALKKFRYDRF